ncbi:MAG: GerMN domain-containing protein [Defluviitaleaceae bacterium]|nr:GerMN domain-containing protein [Defluviitaleaceae bacterium]
MKKFATKKWIFLSVFCAILLFGGIMGAAFLLGEPEEQEPMLVYFFNPSIGQLQPEMRPWPEGDINQQLTLALAHLLSGPARQNLSSTWVGLDAYQAFGNVYLGDDNMLVVNFSPEYYYKAPLQESIFRAALTLTMTGLPYVDSVMFRVGQAETIETPYTIANAPSISPARLTNTSFMLYFVDESGEGLVTEIHEATNVDIQQMGLLALQRLIEGPASEGMFSLIPPETRVRSVIPDLDAGGIYVNLSSEFLTGFQGTPTQARLMLYSIVNTAVHNTPGNINRVFFLIDSDRQDQFHGVSDFRLPFTFNETAMMDYVVDAEYLED